MRPEGHRDGLGTLLSTGVQDGALDADVLSMPLRASDHPASPVPGLREPRRRSSALPLIAETLTPWLAAAFVVAVLNLLLLVGGNPLPVVEQSLLLVGMCATLAAGGLVSARSNRALEELMHDERARPAAEELVAPIGDTRSATYLTGMDGWTTAMLELIDHAVSMTEAGSPAHAELVAAGVETRDLRDLLHVEAVEDLTINDQAKLHALGSLWETSQRRVEHLAAEADPLFHRRWRARAVVARRLRHGHDLPATLVLPYRT